MTIRKQHNVLQLLLYCAFIKQILITEAIGLSSLNNGDQWTFQEGENVTLVCTIVPYTSAQVWKFNNIQVAECASTKCVTYNNKSGVFTFTQFVNRTYGAFYWTINPMKSEFKNNSITCNDGSSTEVTKTITVQELTTPTPSSNKDAILGGGIGGGGGGGALFVITVIVVSVYYKIAKSPNQPGLIEINFPQLRWKRGNNGGFWQTFIIDIYTPENVLDRSFKVKDPHKEFVEHTLPISPEYQVCCVLVLYAKTFKGESTKARFHIPGQPSKPTNFKATKKFNNSVVLQWDNLFCNTCKDKRSYRVIVTPKQTDTNPLEIVTGVTEIEFTGLLSDTEYIAKLTAHNDHRCSDVAECSFETCKDPKPAQNVSLKPGTNNIVVEWQAQHIEGFPQQFTISYKETNTEEWTSATLPVTCLLMYHYEIKNLKERTFYEVKIESKSDLGSTMSWSYNKETKGKPDPPNDVRITGISDTELYIHWSLGSNGGFQQTFIIEETNNRIKCIDHIEDSPFLDGMHTVKGLSPFTTYEFRVGSTNCKGTSWSKTEKVKTLNKKLT